MESSTPTPTTDRAAPAGTAPTAMALQAIGPEVNSPGYAGASAILAWALLIAGAAACAALMTTQIGRAYVDFGDGNYLYIASRMADGLVPYKDIMAPQPPAHLLVGEWLLLLGGKIGQEILVIRWFSILVRLLTGVVVASIARVAAGSRWAGSIAGVVYLFLPNGFIWGLGYESEPLEIFFLALAVRLVLAGTPAALTGAALFSFLAIFTNMTAVPYAALIALWLVIRRPWRSPAYILPLAALGAIGVAALELWTGEYLNNVLFNQVGTYPRTGFLAYATGKILRAGRDIGFMEGIAVILSIVGIALHARRDGSVAREFLPLYAAASLGSLVFVTKGGTMQYIFTIGEPYVAIYFSCLIAGVAFRPQGAGSAPPGHAPKLPAILRGIGASVLLVLALAQAAFMISAQVFDIGPKEGWPGHLQDQPRYLQLSERESTKICDLMRRFTNPRDAILSPPWFAYAARRIVAGEYCEIFIWNIGYWTEQGHDRPGFNPLRRPLPSDGAATRKVLDLVKSLERQEIPMLLLDMNQTGKIPAILDALARRYRILAREEYWTRDTPLLFFIPRKEGESAEPFVDRLDQLFVPGSASSHPRAASEPAP